MRRLVGANSNLILAFISVFYAAEAFGMCWVIAGSLWKSDPFSTIAEWERDFESRFGLESGEVVFPNAADGGDTAGRQWTILMRKAFTIVPRIALADALGVPRSEIPEDKYRAVQEVFCGDIFGMTCDDVRQFAQAKSDEQVILFFSRMRNLFDDRQAALNLAFMKTHMATVRRAVEQQNLNSLDPSIIARVKELSDETIIPYNYPTVRTWFKSVAERLPEVLLPN